jgi:DNA-binding transcriptional MocR family regulator
LIDFMRQADNADLINLAAGVPSPEYLPSRELTKALEEVVASEGASLFAYHHPEGDHRLRSWLASYIGARGVQIKGGQIVITTGCHQALQVMISLLTKPGDVVACETPIYYGLLEILGDAGVKILPLPIHGATGVDPDEAEVAIKKWSPKLVIICSSLSNPSGATMPDDARKALVEICRQNKVRILEDDIYAELVDGNTPKPLRAYDDGSTVAFVTSFSKSVSPGLRVGYCIPGDLHEDFATLKCKQDLHGAVPTQAALRTFFEKGELPGHLNRLRKKYAELRTLGIEAVKRSFPSDAQITETRGGYMLWVSLPRKIDMNKVRNLARERKVAFADGDVFFPVAAEQSHFRLNCAKAAPNDLVKGLETLGEILLRIA